MQPIPTHGELLRAFLAERDVPCQACGYNLRGVQMASCPECGVALSLQVGAQDPRMGRFLGLVVGLSTGAGSAALLLAIMVVLSLYFHDWPPRLVFVPTTVAAVVGGAALALLLRRRGRAWFRERSARAKVAMLAGAWLGAAVWPALTIVAVAYH